MVWKIWMTANSLCSLMDFGHIRFALNEAIVHVLDFMCTHVTVNATTYWTVFACVYCRPVKTEACSIWYRGLTTESHVWGPVENLDKPEMWPLEFLCLNSTRGAQEQRIVGHGHVYFQCSHPYQQLCSSGSEKHWLCKLSLLLTLKDQPCFCSTPKKTETWELRQWRRMLSVCAFTLPSLS